jgi:hypothetical protein
MTNLEENNLSYNQDNEISLQDIINFINDSWKKLFIAGLVGVVLGFGIWYFFVDYTAQIILNNSSARDFGPTKDLEINSNKKNINFDVVSYRVLQKSIPLYISQLISENKVPVGEDRIFKEMSEESYWSKNITPNYAITKNESKEFANLSKDLESAGTLIVSLNLKGNGKTKESAIKNVSILEHHFLSDGAYLDLKALLNQYDGKLFFDKVEINKILNNQKIEQEYLLERLQNLEKLRKEYPKDATIPSQVIDPKDSGAKYLPISTQIIAVNNDINANKELISRLNDKLQDLTILEKFFEKANQLLKDNSDGIEAGEKMLRVINDFQKNESADDLKTQSSLLNIQTDISRIQNLFTKDLVRANEPYAKKQGLGKLVAGGFFISIMLMTLFLIFKKILSTQKTT